MDVPVPLYKNKPPKCIKSNVSHYYLYEKIGEGAWAKVRRAIDAHHNTYACKIYYRCTVERKLKGGYERLSGEYDIVTKVLSNGCSRIVRYHDMLMDADKVYVVLEYCDSGSIERLIGRPIALPAAAKIIADLLEAVVYMHGRQVCHHDLKPGNLLMHQGSVKVADFGVAERMSGEGLAESPYGTPAFQAPEVIRAEGAYDGCKADMWSVGVVLFQLLHPKGALPWTENTVYLVMKEILGFKGLDAAAIAASGLDRDAADLLGQLLSVSPEKRISAEKALLHPFCASTSATRCHLM